MLNEPAGLSSAHQQQQRPCSLIVIIESTTLSQSSRLTVKKIHSDWMERRLFAVFTMFNDFQVSVTGAESLASDMAHVSTRAKNVYFNLHYNY